MTSRENHSIRKVCMLGDRARKQAEKQGLDDNALVLVKTKISSLPQYDITEIKGSPTKFLQDTLLNTQ